MRFVASTEPDDFAVSIDSNTKAIYVESIANPSLAVNPLRELSKVRINSRHSCLLSRPCVRSHMSVVSPWLLTIPWAWEVGFLSQEGPLPSTEALTFRISAASY